MSANHQIIIDKIKSGDTDPIYFLHGEEHHYIDKIMDLIDKTVLEESEKAFNQVSLYGREVDFKMVVDHARQFPMMSDKKVVLLKEAQSMRDFDKLLSYVENPSKQTILAISYKKKIDKRKKIFKTLLSTANSFESKRLYDNQIPQWIDQYVKSKNRKIHPQSALVLASKTGNELSKIVNELDKLCITINEGEEIHGSMVYEQIGLSKDYNIFELQNAISSRDESKAFAIAENFANNEKEHPLPRELATLAGYFQKVALAKAYLHLSDLEFSKKVGLYSPRFAKEYRMAASAYSGAEIQNFFEALFIADKRSKGVGIAKSDSNNLWFDLMFKIFERIS